VTWSCNPPWIHPIDSWQITSVVVRIWRSANDSVGPRSAVDMEKCDRTICGPKRLSGGGIQYTDLDVYGSGGDVADEHVREAVFPGATVGEDAAEPAPEKDDADYLETPRPATAARTFGVERLADDEWVRISVEVEAREA
jgi:hypothetical protein